MKSVLVFGGYGFLGYYLVKELIQRGYSVTIADIVSSDDFGADISFEKCDISDRHQVEKVFKSADFDIVYNMAGFANLDSAANAPLQTLELNVIGNLHILNECVNHKVTNFIYASSAYAMSNKGSFYGISKLASEKIIEEYHKKFQLPFIILRYGSVYSERPYDNNYIYNLIKKAVTDKLIEHEGDGNEIREYIHAADAAKLSVDVIESKEYNNLHIILTGIEKMKRVDLFNMINEILNGGIEIKLNNQTQHNHYQYTPYSFEPSVSKKLIANPHIDMGQGILECIRSVHHENN
jgi:UDP-glucose 4-epimerase